MTTLYNSLVGLETPESRQALARTIKDKAIVLHDLLLAKGEQGPHSWTRPGLGIETFEEWHGLGYYLKVTADNGQSFTLSTEPEFSLATHADSEACFYLVELLLEEPPSAQRAFMLNDANAKAFVHAEKTLAQAIKAIENDRPLDEGISWREALIRGLDKRNSYAVDAESWPHWIERWGTPEMARAMDVASLLADPQRDYDSWKCLVMAAWQQDAALEHHAMPDNIFDAAKMEAAP